MQKTYVVLRPAFYDPKKTWWIALYQMVKGKRSLLKKLVFGEKFRVLYQHEDPFHGGELLVETEDKTWGWIREDLLQFCQEVEEKNEPRKGKRCISATD